MPHKIWKEWNGLGVMITLSGLILGREIHDLNEKLMSDESFRQSRYQIWDFSNIEKLEVSFDQLRGFAIQDSIGVQRNPDQKVAIVHKETPPSGRDRLYHIFAEVCGGYLSRTFNDVDTARKWIQEGAGD